MVKKVIRKALEKTSKSLEVVRGRAPKVELFHWSPDGESENFGDYISKIIVEKLLNKEGHSLEDKIPKYRIWESPKRLIGVGSVIHFAKNNDVIWGSGVNGKKIDTKYYRFDKLDVRLVRGPLTRKFLCNEVGIEVPKLYGDPALIAGSVIDNEIKNYERKISEYIFIPNLNDMEYFDVENTVSPLNDWKYVCASILEAELVISTSLHGIVVAEALQTPARLVQSEVEPMFKYRDYYLGTGRASVEAATSVEEALEMGGRSLPEIDEQRILNSFPMDLWA